jgi:vacuolar-type H+-ATPase subunit I/STV1
MLEKSKAKLAQLQNEKLNQENTIKKNEEVQAQNRANLNATMGAIDILQQLIAEQEKEVQKNSPKPKNKT